MLPDEAGDVIGDGAVAVVGVAGGVSSELGVLAVEGFACGGTGGGGAVVVAVTLPGIDDGVGNVCGFCCGFRNDGGESHVKCSSKAGTRQSPRDRVTIVSINLPTTNIRLRFHRTAG